MAIHVVKGSGAPTVVPLEVGCHYIDTVNRHTYVAVGTASAADWVLTDGGGSSAPVASVFGRTGAITAQTGDYTAAQVGATASNAPITGATKTKITYDAKGLVTAGADLANTDIPAFSGASAGADGTQGGVPKPVAGDESKFLRADGTWQVAGGGGGAVSSVFGRTGAVVATSGDYTADQVGAVAANAPITGGFFTKITFDSKGLVTSGANQTRGDIPAFGGATALAGGSLGGVPASQPGDQNKFLKADATWAFALSPNAAIIGATKTKITYDGNGLVTAGADLANTDIPAFTGATAGAAGSLGGVPSPAAGDQTKFLRADGTWQTVSGGGGGAVSSVFGRTGDVVASSGDYTAAQVGAVASNALITGATRTKITYDAKGLVTAGANLSNTDIPAFTGATAGAAGTLGGVPVAAAGDQAKYLTGAGTWAAIAQVSTSGAGLFPSLVSSLDNATATQLGLKQYLHGTPYNNGESPTIASTQAGFTVIRGVFVPFMMQDGTWRLMLNIVGTFTSASITTMSVSVFGILAKNIPSYLQSVAGWLTTSTGSAQQSFITNNTNVITVNKSIGASGGIIVSGNIELEAKPSWAY